MIDTPDSALAIESSAAHLTLEEKERLYALLQTRERIILETKLVRYVPYPKQKLFHEMGKIYRERLFSAGNQLGKCCTAQSFIDLADGTRATFGELYARNAPFLVLGWDGKQAVVARAVQPIRKPPEPCVRLWFTDGSWVECALKHRVLLARGDYAFVGDVLRQASVPCLQESSSAPGRSARAADAPSWSRITRGSRVGYLRALRFGDALLHRVAVGAQVFLTSLAGVLRPAPLLWPLDGLVLSTHTRSLQLCTSHPSSLRGLRLRAARFVASAGRAVGTIAQRTRLSIQAAQRRALASFDLLRSTDADAQGQDGALLQRASGGPSSAGNQIVAYERVASQEVYDFSVPATSNYITNGVVHHNTLAGGAEVAMHLTGLYPDWWDGYRMHGANRWLAGSESAELTRKGVQRMLFGPPEVESDWGTGMIPKARIKDITRRAGVADAIASAVVLHEDGGSSTIQLQSYDQGRSKWQADTVEGVWFDEEPDLELYSEGMTRTSVSQGPVIVTFTPLLGMSNVVKRFMVDKQPGSAFIQMEIGDALHYTPAQVAKIIEGYPEHEREARARGIPMMGSGRVFPIPESGIKIDAIPIPPHWPRIVGIDFGIDHPSAMVWIAWDRDTDTMYVYDAWRESNTPVQQQVMIYRPRGAWIPVAWPHDGLQRDKHSGVNLAKQYANSGMSMLPEKATFEDGSWGLEAGISEMLDRFQTRRLRVFAHLEPVFEEFRMYHRKDGQIVKKMDDLLSAIRAAIMMKRHAKTHIEAMGDPLKAMRGIVSSGMNTPLDPVAGY